MKFYSIYLVLCILLNVIRSLKINQFNNNRNSKRLLDFNENLIFNEELLVEKYLKSITDTRQRKMFLDKINSKTISQRKKATDDYFFGYTSPSLENYSVFSKTAKDYESFRYYTYDEIKQSLLGFQEKYENLINVTTSQKLYNLPNPIGDCGNKSCESFIVFLGNKSLFKNSTPQMYISCALHGDEKVGPSLCLEFIQLMLENYNKDKWVKFLLDSRMIILTPMTNAYGYYLGFRVKFIINLFYRKK